MKPFRDLPIQRKLLVMTLLICGAILFVAIAALFTFQVVNFRSSLQRDTATLAAIIANNSSAALAFKNPKAGAEVIGSLQANPTVIAACLALPDGSRFAQFGKPEGAIGLSQFPPAAGFRYSGRYLLWTQPVKLDQKKVGTLYLRLDYRQSFQELVGLYGQVTLGVMGTSIALAVLLTGRLRRTITDPVLKLAELAHSVGEKKDYSLRGTVTSRGDELGRLTEGFNQMLSQIERQNGALQIAQNQLARQVEELKERARLASFDAVVGLALTRNDNLQGILQQCTQAVVDYLGAAFARIWTLNRAEQVLELEASAGIYTHCNGAHQRVPVGQFKIGLIASRGEPLLTNTVVGDKRVHDQEWAKREKMVSFAGIPLMVGNKLVGVVAMFGRQPITETAFQTLGSAANAIALGIERKRTEAALRENEERFRSLFENVRIGLYRCTADGRVLMGNPTFFRMLGCDAPELTYAKARGGLSSDLLKTLDGSSAKAPASINLDEVSSEAPGSRRRFRNLLEAEGEVVGAESCWKRIDGSVIHVRESARAFRNAQGTLVYSEGTVEDITERKKAEAELDKMHRELREASRQAGMAEVATGVLHNVGNVLNSVNVSTILIREKLRDSEVASLVKLGGLLQQHEADLPGFLTAHPKGKLVPRFIIQLADQIGAEHTLLQEEQDKLTRNVEHIKEIVSMQQNYARVSGIIEPISVAKLLDDALQINAAGFARHGVQVVRQYSDVPPATADKHKVLQILVNLVHNAKYALDDSDREDKRITVGVGMNGGNRLKVTVSDNGIGIPPENLTRIFSHGFSTRKGGHGFGLHSGANAAKEMGGQLSVHSEGAGQGATFTLELPLARQTTEQKIDTSMKRRTET